jgi:hypothetical protein
MRITSISLFILLITAACEETTIINRDTDYEPNLVVTGFIGNQGPALVYIQKTQHPLKPKEDEPVIAEVLLNMADQTPVILDTFEMNFYSSEGKLLGYSGKSYSLKVLSSEFGTISSAPVMIPEAIRIDSVKFVETKYGKGNIHIHFTDPPGKNYYSLKILKFFRDGTLYDRDDTYYALVNPYSVFDDVGANNGEMHEIINTSISEYINDQWVRIGQISS